MDKMCSRLTTAEQRLGHVEDTVENHGADLRAIHTKIRALEYISEAAENRNRRNNLHIVGMAEGAEGQRPTEFGRRERSNSSTEAQFLPFYAVERAHRIPSKPGPPGAPPCTFILKFLNFRRANCCTKITKFSYFLTTQWKLKNWRSFNHVKAAQGHLLQHIVSCTTKGSGRGDNQIFHLPPRSIRMAGVAPSKSLRNGILFLKITFSTCC